MNENDPYAEHPSDLPAPPRPPVYPQTAHPPGGLTYCPGCGANLSGMPIGGQCPRCGRAITPGSFGGQGSGSSGKAVAGMVLGICALPGCLFYAVPGIVCAIIGLILSNQALKDIDAGLSPESSRGMANAGRICSLIALILASIGIFALCGIFFFAIAAGP